MDHNDFDFIEDLIIPFYRFLKQIGLNTRQPRSAFPQMCIKQQYFVIPKAFYVDDGAKHAWACCYNRTGNQYNIDIRSRGSHPQNGINRAGSSYYKSNMMVGGGDAHESNELSSLEEPKMVQKVPTTDRRGPTEICSQKWHMLRSFGNSVGHSQRLYLKRQDSGIDLTSCKKGDQSQWAKSYTSNCQADDSAVAKPVTSHLVLPSATAYAARGEDQARQCTQGNMSNHEAIINNILKAASRRETNEDVSGLPGDVTPRRVLGTSPFRTHGGGETSEGTTRKVGAEGLPSASQSPNIRQKRGLLLHLEGSQARNRSRAGPVTNEAELLDDSGLPPRSGRVATTVEHVSEFKPFVE